MPNEISFYLNGKQVKLSDPAPDLLLIDYLALPKLDWQGRKNHAGRVVAAPAP